MRHSGIYWCERLVYTHSENKKIEWRERERVREVDWGVVTASTDTSQNKKQHQSNECTIHQKIMNRFNEKFSRRCLRSDSFIASAAAALQKERTWWSRVDTLLSKKEEKGIYHISLCEPLHMRATLEGGNRKKLFISHSLCSHNSFIVAVESDIVRCRQRQESGKKYIYIVKKKAKKKKKWYFLWHNFATTMLFFDMSCIRMKVSLKYNC